MKRLAPLLVLALLLAGFAGSAQARKPGELVIGVTQFPSTFHPNIDSMLAKSYVLAMTRRPLTSHDADWKLICMLCVTLPTIENGLAKPEMTPDAKLGMAVTFTLKPGVRWGDGVAVTSRDVVFTWKVGRHPRSGVSGMEFYRSLYKIDVLDARSFTLHFDKRNFDYNNVNLELLPAHLDEKIFDADPADYKNRTKFDTDTTNPGLYFGPYRITGMEAGSHVVLEPNPTWWGKRPHFKRIVVRVIANTAALEANLLSGAIDMIAGELGLTVDQAIAFEKRHGRRFRVLYKPGLIYEHIDLNLDNPALQDRHVRHALILGIDRGAISSQLFAGRQPVAHSSVNPLDRMHSPAVPKYAHDRRAAAILLDKAGWNRIKRGIRHDAKGRKLAFELMTTAGNRSRELVEQVLQSQWRELGIEIRIRNQPARVFFGQTVTQRKFKAMAMFAWISAPESVPRATLHSKHIPTKANNWGGQNYTGFKSPEMDKVIEAIEIELDEAKRRKLWARFQEIYATELPILPLYFRANAHILPNWLTGLRPTGHQGTTTLWVEEWGVR